VHPVNGGLWTDHYKVLLKLEESAPAR
jgi:hypothetical protein